MESNTEVRPATYIPHVRMIIIFGRILRDVRAIDDSMVLTSYEASLARTNINYIHTW